MGWVDLQSDMTSSGGAHVHRNGTTLKGISIGGKLSVIIIRRDYMCSMESISLPVRSVHYSPGVFRFMTNVVVYALTHGSISDYSDYIPEDLLLEKELPTRPPAAARVGGFE